MFKDIESFEDELGVITPPLHRVQGMYFVVEESLLPYLEVSPNRLRGIGLRAGSCQNGFQPSPAFLSFVFDGDNFVVIDSSGRESFCYGRPAGSSSVIQDKRESSTFFVVDEDQDCLGIGRGEDVDPLVDIGEYVRRRR